MLLESKYQLLINGREKLGIKRAKNQNIDYSQKNGGVYENLEDFHVTKKRKVLIAFYDMIPDMKANKKSPVVTELFLRERKLNISLVFYHNFISKCLKL